MLAAVGVLIPLGDQLDKLFAKRPVLFIAWVGCIMLLVVWMVMMALGDWLSTVTYSAIAKSRLRYERRELEDEIRTVSRRTKRAFGERALGERAFGGSRSR